MTTTRQKAQLTDGVYRGADGRLKANVTVGPRGATAQRSKRFAAGTPVAEIVAWQESTRTELRDEFGVGGVVERGTFADDAARYLEAVAAMRSFKDRKRDIKLWVAEFGKLARHRISTLAIESVLQRWLVAGVARNTVRNRRAALAHLFNKVDPKRAGRNAAALSVKPPKGEELSYDVDYATIQRVLDAMPDRGQGRRNEPRGTGSKTKARLAVIAYTGLPHAILNALQPSDVDLVNGIVFVPKRRKGKGVERREIGLLAPGLDAFKRFAELDCWTPRGAKPFSNSSMRQSWRRACKRAGVTYFHPYALRHSFATAAYKMHGDAAAVGELLMHARGSKLTARYAQGGVSERARVTLAALDGALKLVKGAQTDAAVSA